MSKQNHGNSESCFDILSCETIGFRRTSKIYLTVYLKEALSYLAQTTTVCKRLKKTGLKRIMAITNGIAILCYIQLASALKFKIYRLLDDNKAGH